MIGESHSQGGLAPFFPSPLRSFELSIISKFLSFHEKLITLPRLNKAWYSLLRKHYAWTYFPPLLRTDQEEPFVSFVDGFESLAGIQIA